MKKFTLFILVFIVGCTPQLQGAKSSTVTSSPEKPIPLATTGPTGTLAFPSTTPSASRTPRPTEPLDPAFATREAAVASCSGGNDSKFIRYNRRAYSSNNDQWFAVVCQDNGIYTKVFNPEQGIVWNVPAIDDDDTISGPEWYWVPYLWSGNGRYLYLKPVCLCFIDSPWLIYSSGYGLSRLDLFTGRVDIWLKPSHNPWYTFAFTEDGNLFAYSPDQLPGTIKIWDLVSGKEQNLSFKEKYSILEYRWTPDNSRLVIFTEEHVNGPSNNGFSVFVYSISGKTLRKLLDKNNLNSSFPTEEFIEPRIYISGLSNDELMLSDIFEENNFQLNIKTGELIQINKTITPTPTP